MGKAGDWLARQARATLGRTVRQIRAASRDPMPDDQLADIRARASPMTKGSEYAAWYSRDVPRLLDEIDRLRYELESKTR